MERLFFKTAPNNLQSFVKNAKKSDMVERQVGVYENRQAYNALHNCLRTKEKAPWQQVQFSSPLINILFSDKFAGDFAKLGNVASRSLLDTGKAANDQRFWEKARADFIKQDDNYDVMRFQEDNVFAAGFNVNTGAIVLLDQMIAFRSILFF